MKMTHSEAGKLGALKSRDTHKRLFENRVAEYNKSPNTCKKCGNPLPYDLRKNDFCCHACSAAFNNAKRSLSIQQKYEKSIQAGGDGHKYVCIQCGNFRVRVDNPFCSDSCKLEYLEKHKCDSKTASKTIAGINAGRTKWEDVKKTIKETKVFPACSTTNETRRNVVRKYLEEENGHSCAVCGRQEWNDKPIPLIVDHIDGVSTNHSIENFRLICPNCDATSETFKNKHSRKSSRTWRKKYYHPRSGQVPDAQNVDDERGFEVVFS